MQDSDSHITDSNKGAGHDPMRRMVVSAITGTAGLLAMTAIRGAQAQEADAPADEPPPDVAEKDGVFNSINRIRSFDKNEMDSGKPWIPSQTGNFDLDDPAGNRLAMFKMTHNLSGKRTYIPMLVRILLGREEIAGGRLLGAASMFTWQLQEPDPEEFPGIPEGTAVMRSMYTARYLDIETMEPVEELENPYNGKTMKLEDYVFIENFLSYPKGGSTLIEERQFSDDDPDVPRVRLIKKWGDELVLFNGGNYEKPGVHQPRFTENMWVCPYDAVMDPDVDFVPMRYSYMSVKKAYERPWTGYTTEDGELFCSLAQGKKVHSADDLPDYHKRLIAEKYPDRL